MIKHHATLKAIFIPRTCTFTYLQDYRLNMKATSLWDACMHMICMVPLATRSRFGTADPNRVHVYYILFDLLQILIL